MGLAIKNNIMAGNAARHLGKSFGALANSVERLSSGLRINSAKDDAAGLAVRELMRADIAVLQQGSRNASDGISMLQTMEGATAVMDENLIRMKELAEQAATGSYSNDQRAIMNSEFAEMAEEIERIANSTAFNGISMLNAGSGTVDIHVGTTEVISVEKVDMTQSGLGIETGGGEESLTTKDALGVSSASDNFLTLVENDTGTDSVAQIKIAFTGTTQADIDVDYAVGKAETVTRTLQQVADDINLVTQNYGKDENGDSLAYQAAEVVYDSANSQYELKISSREGGNTAMAVTIGEAGSGLADDVKYTMGDIAAGGGAVVTDDIATTAEAIAGFDAMAAGASCNILTETDAKAALVTVGDAIKSKDEARAAFGYKMNRLESTQSVLNIQSENLMTSESRISDVDVATEMATMTRNQVLSQAGVAMLSQANTMPQMALSLLR